MVVEYLCIPVSVVATVFIIIIRHL